MDEQRLSTALKGHWGPQPSLVPLFWVLLPVQKIGNPKKGKVQLCLDLHECPDFLARR